ncbi:lipopolysaccharide biosynthesis protein [Rhodococcus sp. IEGM 1381]|uniref:lipopolysaccharide biosynthesis protein n=1 Tax=Rhodococcus sp. IEGM 1381 TaxID=3047085 RepID=UPI0024B6E8E5|nr:lipopolysaccharide biosynthesis protein [Rhodococcus sp. IEGM 1381]MDI9894217.1 lipopolysaccharide biosynthesis protein [Rhodococcus sp. IEGM 1381]
MTESTTSHSLERWDPPRDDLGRAARAGVRQTTLFRILSLVVQFVSAAILARLLGPAAFGTIALATLVTAFATIFNDMGIGSAIIQRKKLDEPTLTTAFLLNAAAGVVLASAITAASPWLADFFESPDLRFILPLSSLTLVLSLSLVQRSLLQRKMNFGAVMALDFMYGIISAIVSVVLVLLGMGVEAIPIGAITATAISSIAAAIWCPWRPRRRPTWESTKSLWGYSGHVLAFNILNYWSKNIDNLLVGKFLGDVSLGYYSRAYNLMQLPVTNLNRVLSTVLFPALSSLQTEKERFRRGWLLSSQAGLAVGFWVAIVTAVASPYLIEVLYGNEWLPMATTLTILMIATPAYILSSNASPIFLALGATRLQFRLGLATAALRVVSIVIGLQFGYVGVAVGILASGYLNLGITTWPAMRLAGITVRSLANSQVWILAAAAFAAVVGIAARTLTHFAPLISLVLIGATTSVAFFSALFIFDKSLISALRNRKN